MTLAFFIAHFHPKDVNRELAKACELPALLREGDTENRLVAASAYFMVERDVPTFLQKFVYSDNKTRKRLCSEIGASEASATMSCLAQNVGRTIGLDFGRDVTFFGITIEYGVSLLWGENGQFACAHNGGVGGALDFIGVGASAGGTIRSVANGGWETVAPWEPRMCLTAGWTALVGLAATMIFDPSVLIPGEAISMVRDALTLDKFKGIVTVPAILGLLSDLTEEEGVDAIGVDTNVGFEVLDATLLLSVVPDISVTFCSERLVYCDGEGCEGKVMVN